MGDKARSFTNFWSWGRVRHLSFSRWHLFTEYLATNSIVAGLFLLVVPALQLKGRYLRVGRIYLTAACICWWWSYGKLGTLLAVVTVMTVCSSIPQYFGFVDEWDVYYRCEPIMSLCAYLCETPFPCEWLGIVNELSKCNCQRDRHPCHSYQWSGLLKLILFLG